MISCKILRLQNRPCLYEQGKTVSLVVTKRLNDQVAVGELFATVVRLYSMTMSPVMDILYTFKSGETKEAVIKVFGRRSGHIFRKMLSLPGKGCPVHTPRTEAAWPIYVRDGRAETLYGEIKAELEQSLPSWAAVWESTG